MFRVTLPVLAAVAMFATVGTANAQCCGNGGLFTSGYNFSAGWGSGCCNTGYSVSPVVVQAAPIVVQAQPVVVQQPVLVQQPVVVQQQPVVQQYVVNQGPVYSGPAITRLSANYYPPRAVGAYPYVGARSGGYYRRAAWGPRPYVGHRYRGPHHHYHAPISRYN